MTRCNLALALCALLSITAGTLYQKRFVAPCDVRIASVVQLVAAFVVACRWRCWRPSRCDWHPELIGAMAWSVLVLTLGGSSLLYLLIQRGAATAVTSLLYLVPPCTALMAWALFGESLTPAHDGGHGADGDRRRLVVRAGRRRTPRKDRRHERRRIGSPSSPATASARRSCPRACASSRRRPRFDIDLAVRPFDFASWEYYERHGQMMPDDWKDVLAATTRSSSAPSAGRRRCPDHVSLWGSLLKFRRDFDQYVNLRPARLMPGIRSPLVDRRQPRSRATST